MRDRNNERWNKWCMQSVSYWNVRDKWDGTSVGYPQIGVSKASRSYGRNNSVGAILHEKQLCCVVCRSLPTHLLNFRKIAVLSRPGLRGAGRYKWVAGWWEVGHAYMCGRLVGWTWLQLHRGGELCLPRCTVSVISGTDNGAHLQWPDLRAWGV